jgi:hypothetical protein
VSWHEESILCLLPRVPLGRQAHISIRLGVKKERKVFRRDMFTIEEDSVVRLTPPGTEQMVNQTLIEILDTFFSDPY